MISTEAAYAAVRQLRSMDPGAREEARALIEVWLDERASEAFVREMERAFSEPSAYSRREPSSGDHRKGLSDG